MVERYTRNATCRDFKVRAASQSYFAYRKRFNLWELLAGLFFIEREIQCQNLTSPSGSVSPS